jgi:hypothetical protein
VVSVFAGKKPKEIPMTPRSERHDYITTSLPGVVTLLIVIAGFVLMAAWFYSH